MRNLLNTNRCFRPNRDCFIVYWGPSNEFIAMKKFFAMKIHCNEKYAMKTMKYFY